MKIGLVGAPSSGKSTFFKAATLAEVEISPRPFTTIKPNHGIGYIKVDCADKELNVECNSRAGFCLKNKRFYLFNLFLYLKTCVSIISHIMQSVCSLWNMTKIFI